MDPDKDSEEFNNFMYRATEVNSIVKQLCSGDPAQYGTIISIYYK